MIRYISDFQHSLVSRKWLVVEFVCLFVVFFFGAIWDEIFKQHFWKYTTDSLPKNSCILCQSCLKNLEISNFGFLSTAFFFFFVNIRPYMRVKVSNDISSESIRTRFTPQNSCILLRSLKSSEKNCEIPDWTFDNLFLFFFFWRGRGGDLTW